MPVWDGRLRPRCATWRTGRNTTRSPYYKKDKVLLERVQHRFTRMVPGLKTMHYDLWRKAWDCGLWRKHGIEPICLRCSKCIKVYHWHPSASYNCQQYDEHSGSYCQDREEPLSSGPAPFLLFPTSHHRQMEWSTARSHWFDICERIQ